MISLFVDTAVLAIPNYGVDAESAEEIIARAFSMSDIAASDLPIRLCLRDGGEDLLWAIGCGPDFEVIGEFLSIMDLRDVYSAMDVVKVYGVLADRPHKIPTSGDLASFDPIVVDPDEVAAMSPTELADESRRCLITASELSDAGGVDAFVPGWAATIAKSIQISRIDRRGGIDCPRVTSLPLVRSLRSLIEYRMGAKLWVCAVNADDIHLAIAIRAAEMLVDTGVSMDQVRLHPFCLGSEFFGTLEKWQAAGSQPFAQVCLDNCAQIVAGVIGKHVRAMGKKHHEKRDRDKAGAFRVHVTEQKQGLRLMYWDTKAGIEFANVGPKKEEVILPGKSAGVVCFDVSRFGL